MSAVANSGRARATVGVIGHVDHGKTTLVKALTGMDTDRLPEEKARGMSIVPGFAWLALPEGEIDLIDVPGHESLVRAMMAGASGIDAALLVLDAREGVKPQTLEHLAIARLLGVRRGAIALNKCDLAGPAQQAQALRALQAALRGHPLEFAPVIMVSALRGDGLQALKQAMAPWTAEREDEPGPERFFLPVDRVFAAPGHGTVVTGTLRGGLLRLEDRVQLMPSGEAGSVRRLEVHGQPVDHAVPGQRVGVNLRHLSHDRVQRGDVLAFPGLVQAAQGFDVELQALAGQRGLRNGERLRLLAGTWEVPARLRLLSGERLEPGQRGFAQLQCARPVPSLPGAAFILRSDAPPATVGGGRFLALSSARARRDAQSLRRFAALAGGDRGQALQVMLLEAGYGGLELAGLQQGDLPMLAGLGALRGRLRAWHPAHVVTLSNMLLAALERFHREHPARRGAPLAWCRAALPSPVGRELFEHLVEQLREGKRIISADGLLCRLGHDPFLALSEQDQRLAGQIESVLRQGGLNPALEDMPGYAQERFERVLRLLADSGRVVILPGQCGVVRVVLHAQAVREAERRLREAFAPPAAFTVSQARQALCSTRKFVVPLLEHLQKRGVSARRKDLHAMLGPQQPSMGGG